MKLKPATLAAINELELALKQIDALRERRKLSIVNTRAPGGITSIEYAERYQCGLTTARRQLADFVKDGEMHMVLVREYGQSCTTKVFYPCTPKT